MVYMSMLLVKANEVFAPTQDFNPGSLFDALSGVDNLAQAAQLLGMETAVAPEWQQPLLDFLETIPPAIDAAALAAVRDSLERGIRVTVTWQPAYAFELRVWDVTRLENDEWLGLVNVHISSRDPEMEG
jgi:hypothetical protein